MIPRQDPASGEWACEHGVALDVHCCNCHSGFLFDIDSCSCTFEPEPDPGLPRLVDRFLYPHALMCRSFGCRHPVEWLDFERNAITVGWCDVHRTRSSTVPIAIFGREWEGWEPWPLSLVRYLTLKKRGLVA